MASLKRKAAAGLSAGADPKKVRQQSSLMSFFASPAPASARGASTSTTKASSALSASSTAAATGSRFDKAKWVAGLTAEQKELLKLEIDTLGESWLAALKDDLTTPSFLDLKRFLQREHNAGKKIFPPPEDLYSWSRYSPLQSVEVVILGQDPYHNIGQAHGLAFSVKPPIAPPPSLRNMFIALKNDYPDTFVPPPPAQAGLLAPWAERGVLMLNTVLTVRAHDPSSHANHGWEKFTQRVLDVVAQRRTSGVVFMAWGSLAAKRVAKIDRKRHLVLTSVHPSPLSAHRGFFECRHFRTANEWLVKRYGPEGEINWSLAPGTSTVAPVAVKEKKEAEKTAAEMEGKTEEEEIKAESKEKEPEGSKTETKRDAAPKEEDKENARQAASPTGDETEDENTGSPAPKSTE